MTKMSKLDSPKTIWRLLAELAKHQQDLGVHGKSTRAKRLRREISEHFSPVTREQLEKAKESDYSAFPRKTFLHLPPDEKGGQPVMRASFEKCGEHMVFRIRAAILVEEVVPDNGGDKQKHRGIGIRFEGPEGPKGKSNHDYAHAQWFCSFEKDTDVLPGCPPWLPVNHPAIPIPADNAVDILCCALKSFYGADSEPLRWLANMVTTRENLPVLGSETRDQIKQWAKEVS